MLGRDRSLSADGGERRGGGAPGALSGREAALLSLATEGQPRPSAGASAQRPGCSPWSVSSAALDGAPSGYLALGIQWWQ